MLEKYAQEISEYLSSTSCLRYLKKHSQTALSKGYPFLEKDCTTFRESNSCRKAEAVYWVPRSEWNIRP